MIVCNRRKQTVTFSPFSLKNKDGWQHPLHTYPDCSEDRLFASSLYCWDLRTEHLKAGDKTLPAKGVQWLLQWQCWTEPLGREVTEGRLCHLWHQLWQSTLRAPRAGGLAGGISIPGLGCLQRMHHNSSTRLHCWTEINGIVCWNKGEWFN